VSYPVPAGSSLAGLPGPAAVAAPAEGEVVAGRFVEEVVAIAVEVGEVWARSQSAAEVGRRLGTGVVERIAGAVVVVHMAGNWA
jgi:hypothetical protein